MACRLVVWMFTFQQTNITTGNNPEKRLVDAVVYENIFNVVTTMYFVPSNLSEARLIPLEMGTNQLQEKAMACLISSETSLPIFNLEPRFLSLS